LLLIDFVLVLLFCTLLSLATGLLNEGNLHPKDVSAISALTMQDTDTPTSTPNPTRTATPTPTFMPTVTPTPRNTPTEEPTKAPYVFPKPIYTREKPMPTRLMR
jgi:hypothetical protein